jgi:DNA-binding NarL/FixJ family response regulator
MKFVVLIAEPQKVLRTGIKSIFLDDSHVTEVHEVATERELQLCLRETNPYFIVVNQIFLSAIARMHSRPFLVLAEEPDIVQLQTAYKHAARGYLSVNAPADLLRSTLRSSEQSFLIEPTLVPWLMGALFHNIHPHFKEDTLTPREKEIIHLLRGGLDRSVIAEQLGIAETTLKVHLKNITKKSNGWRRKNWSLHKGESGE